MTSNVHGDHHITAIASNPQKTVDFYTNLLGLRLVKKSVNQDDVKTYHLFFGQLRHFWEKYNFASV
jgi:glyoxalase family protein